MNKFWTTSFALLAATLLISAPSFATTRCRAEKHTVSTTKSSNKTAQKNLTKQQRLVDQLGRKVEKDVAAVEKKVEQQSIATARKVEQYKKQQDTWENKRLNFLAYREQLIEQIAACAAQGWINELLGTSINCSAGTRNALLADAANALSQATVLQGRIEAADDRGRRDSERVFNSYTAKITSLTQQQVRDQNRLNLETAKLPGLQAKATQAEAVFNQADDKLTQCLSLG